jgi:hypothetical protein
MPQVILPPADIVTAGGKRFGTFFVGFPYVDIGADQYGSLTRTALVLESHRGDGQAVVATLSVKRGTGGCKAIQDVVAGAASLTDGADGSGNDVFALFNGTMSLTPHREFLLSPAPVCSSRPSVQRPVLCLLRCVWPSRVLHMRAACPCYRFVCLCVLDLHHTSLCHSLVVTARRCCTATVAVACTGAACCRAACTAAFAYTVAALLMHAGVPCVEPNPACECPRTECDHPTYCVPCAAAAALDVWPGVCIAGVGNVSQYRKLKKALYEAAVKMGSLPVADAVTSGALSGVQGEVSLRPQGLVRAAPDLAVQVLVESDGRTHEASFR